MRMDGVVRFATLTRRVFRALGEGMEESVQPAGAGLDTPRHGVAAEAMQWPG
jgi:hypothetical protein